jgi:hydrogenase maturation protease
MPRSVVVIGVGNELRGDDGAGLEAARRVRESDLPASVTVHLHEGEAVGLLELWDGADAAVLVDTVRSGAPPGTIHRLDASHAPVPSLVRRSSSHTIGIGEAIELARALGTLPSGIRVYGVEGRQFEAGTELSDEVAAALDPLVRELRAEALRVSASYPPRPAVASAGGPISEHQCK